MTDADIARDDVPPRPTFAQFFSVARRPRWIAGLVLALAIAAAFAALGQWQLERSVQNVAPPVADTETPVALTEVATAGQAMTDPSIGQRVTVDGAFVAGDFDVLTGRDNDGEVGAWLVGHLVTADGDSLAVGLGWAADADAAAAAERAVPTGEVLSLAGRYLPSESPELDDVEAGEHRAFSIGDQINRWREPGPVFAGFLVLAEPSDGLEAIHQPPPFRDTSLNWLNLFYALEWVIFAGFAVYLWYRVVRDVWEKEHEEAHVD